MDSENSIAVLLLYQEFMQEIIKNSHTAAFHFTNAEVSVRFSSNDARFLTWAPEHFMIDCSPVTEQISETDAEVYHVCHDGAFERIRQAIPSHSQTPAEDAQLLAICDPHVAIFYQHCDDQHVSNEYYAILDKRYRRILLISRGYHRSLSLLIMRILRQFLHYLAVEKGWMPFHSACCAWENMGICIVGDKFTGKTTTLISLLETGKVRLLSNDKLLLAAQNDDIQAIALPHKIGIRIGTVLLSEHLRAWLERAVPTTYPQPALAHLLNIAQNLSDGELRTSHEKVFFMPYELAKAFNTFLIPQVSVACFILPVYDSKLYDVKLERLSHDMAYEQLLAHYLPLDDQGSRFLRYFFSFDDQILLNRLSMLLTNYLKQKPVYRVYQNKETRLEAVKQIQTLLADGTHLAMKKGKIF